ncbi:hypothetical protein M407DRAFT_28762 [Tulasnella calospora MUT 4182]|uniref:Uncharacterized protein n=1 Tax=Tulasnella calospora MUT 4182 TaxID=1051891 RepID=A0A0C3Q0W6_9AGAM|nr:hypothetical protein M407DRAFT_28762 [Tulasnella calospora MUT 4182]
MARTDAWYVGTACIRYSESTTPAISRSIEEIDRAIPGLCDVLGLTHAGAPTWGMTCFHQLDCVPQSVDSELEPPNRIEFRSWKSRWKQPTTFMVLSNIPSGTPWCLRSRTGSYGHGRKGFSPKALQAY